MPLVSCLTFLLWRYFSQTKIGLETKTLFATPFEFPCLAGNVSLDYIYPLRNIYPCFLVTPIVTPESWYVFSLSHIKGGPKQMSQLKICVLYFSALQHRFFQIPLSTPFYQVAIALGQVSWIWGRSAGWSMTLRLPGPSSLTSQSLWGTCSALPGQQRCSPPWWPTAVTSMGAICGTSMGIELSRACLTEVKITWEMPSWPQPGRGYLLTMWAFWTGRGALPHWKFVSY